MSVVLQVDPRESNDLSWLDSLKFDGKLAAVTSKHVDTALPILQVKRGEELVILHNDSWSDRLSGSYLLEVRYSNGYTDYQDRLRRLGAPEIRHDKMPLFEGAYVKTCLKWESEFEDRDLITGKNFRYTRSHTWYGCYLKGKIMRDQGFISEAVEWFRRAKDMNPKRLEVLAALHLLGHTPSAHEISEALDDLDLPFHAASRDILKRLV